VSDWDEHKEDSRARWAQHVREHEMLEAELRQHDRETNDKILAALQTLMRHEEQLKHGAKSFEEGRQERAAMLAEVEALKPKRRTWVQIAAAVGSVICSIVLATWLTANYMRERATLGDVQTAITEHVRVERPAIERIAAQVSDVQLEQAAQRQQIHDVKDDVKEIKSDLKEALRRGR
jgi:hypothetical protein